MERTTNRQAYAPKDGEIACSRQQQGQSQHMQRVCGPVKLPKHVRGMHVLYASNYVLHILTAHKNDNSLRNFLDTLAYVVHGLKNPAQPLRLKWIKKNLLMKTNFPHTLPDTTDVQSIFHTNQTHENQF